jgi:putative membrane protein
VAVALPGEIHASVVVGTAALAGAWLGAWRARRARPRPGEALAFAAAVASLLLALDGPVHDLAEQYLFTAHMVQHLLLTLAFPPLLLLGTPGFMIDGLVGAAARLRGLVPAARWLTRPVPALALHAVALFAWHLPGPYDLALAVHGWHIVEHLTLIGTAVLAWWPVLSRSSRLPALPYAAQILYLFVFGMPMTVVAAMVTVADEPLYAFYASAPRLVAALGPLEDQRLGGVIMWVPAGLIPLLAFTIVFFRWAAAEAKADEAEHGPSPAG